MLVFIFYFLVICAGTGGELCVSRAMKAVGEVKDFRPAALVGVVLRALRVSWMWIGLGLMATAFFSLLAVLSRQNVSVVVPGSRSLRSPILRENRKLISRKR